MTKRYYISELEPGTDKTIRYGEPYQSRELAELALEQLESNPLFEISMFVEEVEE